MVFQLNLGEHFGFDISDAFFPECKGFDNLYFFYFIFYASFF